jgi:hypothetical protein
MFVIEAITILIVQDTSGTLFVIYLHLDQLKRLSIYPCLECQGAISC